MLIFEIIAICSSASAVVTATVKVYNSFKNNKYAANYARIYELNQHERGKFTEIVVPKRAVVEGHTHGDSAAARSAGSSAAAAYAYAINRTPFLLSMSAADQRADREGERTMHWSKDFNAEARRAEPGVDSVLVLVDVDEHIEDLPKKLHNYFLPAILYTFQPSAASATCKDYRYTFNKDNQVEYDVTGGGHYQHKVWDYSPDCLTMRKKFLGLTYAKSYFTVEKRYIDDNHQLVLLTPLAKFGLLGSILSCFVAGDDLKRLQPVQGDFARMVVSKSLVGAEDYAHVMSTSRLGMYNSATITVEQDNALALAAQNSESKLSPFQVKTMIPGISNESATTLVDFHRMKKVVSPTRVVVPSDAVNNYTYYATFTTQEKPSVIPFMAPLLSEAYAPTQSVESDESMIKGRIEDLRAKAKPLGEKELKYANEFAALLKAEVSGCEPVGHEEIVAKLSRPSQRRITEEAAFAVKMETLIKSFMKKEAYQKPTDARPIATVNGKDKYEYSAYTYAVSEALKRTSWYAFGRKPRQISERVSEVCMAAAHVILTDLSRFDGRVNLSLRQLEEIVMKALFDKKHWKEMLRLMKTQYGAPGITRLGRKYKNGYNRQSGSPETAVFNTICNAFMAYVTFREAGCEPTEAYKRLGVYGGDDGLTPDVDSELYTKTAARFGHVLEAEKILRGNKGVSFLARLYSPGVWFGDVNSCADIARALSKLHTTVALSSDVTPEDKLFEKAYALFLTDSNTPIIGDFVTRVVELSGKGSSEYKNILNIWNSELDEDEQYPNADIDLWMSQVLIDQNLDGFRLADMREWLADCKTMSDFLQAPSFIDKPDIKLAKVPMKLNDDLMPAQDEMDELIRLYKERKGETGDASFNKPPTIPKTTLDASSGSNTKHEISITSSPNTMAHIYLGASQPSAKVDAPVPPTKPPHSSGHRNRVPGKKSRASSRSGGVGYQRGGPYNGSPNTLDVKRAGHVSKSKYRAKIGACEQPDQNSAVCTPVARVTDVVGSQINGNQGSATNTDDHPVVSPPTVLSPFEQAFKDTILDSGAREFVQNHENDFEHITGLIGDKVSKAVHYVVDPILDRFASEQPTYPALNNRIPPKELLVGVELNPGPVVIPVKGNKVRTGRVTSSQAKQINAALRVASGRTKRRRRGRQGNSSVTQSVAAAYSTGLTSGKPIIIHQNDDSVRIKHRELVAIVNGTVNFTASTFSIQPGLASTFPWLATQCAGWEKYKWNMLRATYYTRTGTSTPGSVLLVPDYDAADPAPLTEQAASTFHGVADDAPWKRIDLEFDMRRSRELFLRQGPLAANLDVKTYDFGNLFICTADGTAVNWGKVYLEYDVTLINSQMIVATNGGGKVVPGGTLTPAAPLGTAPVITNGFNILSVTTGNTINLVNLIIGGKYLWSSSAVGTGLTAISSTATGLTLTASQNDLVNAAGTIITDLTECVATASTATLFVGVTGTTVTDGRQFFCPLA